MQAMHYFNTFLNPMDLVWSCLAAVAMAVVIMLVHTSSPPAARQAWERR
jgi:ABC-type transporter Mla maintaining outer membrane lipid asymmetry permease subunit MlaE